MTVFTRSTVRSHEGDRSRGRPSLATRGFRDPPQLFTPRDHRPVTCRPLDAKPRGVEQLGQVVHCVRVVHANDPLRPREVLDRLSEVSELPVHECGDRVALDQHVLWSEVAVDDDRSRSRRARARSRDQPAGQPSASNRAVARPRVRDRRRSAPGRGVPGTSRTTSSGAAGSRSSTSGTGSRSARCTRQACSRSARAKRSGPSYRFSILPPGSRRVRFV